MNITLASAKNFTGRNASPQNARVKETYPQESRVVLFGNDQDPEILRGKAKLLKQGRAVVITSRPGFDTGTGMCGNHLCHCKEICKAKFE